jgi:hypothetical protein
MGLFLVAACEMPSPTLNSETEAVSSEQLNAQGQLSPVRDSDIGLGDPSLAADVGRDDQSAAPGSFEIVSRGRPNAKNLLALLQRHFPEALAGGLDEDQALWVAVDGNGRIRKSWVGPKLIFDLPDGSRPPPFLSLPEGSPERIAYEAHLRKKAAMLQQNVPDMQIRSEIFLGSVWFVAEAPGRPLHDGRTLIHDLVVHIDEPMTN